MSMNLCPNYDRCGFSSEGCTEEMSAACSVINRTATPPPKEWGPQEPVAVTLTREQWQVIMAQLVHNANWNHVRMTWWRECCNDKKMGAATAAKYEAAMKEVESLCKIIEEATCGQ